MFVEDRMYVEVIVPVSAMGYFTYEVPPEMKENIKVGIRVEVEFGKRKHYAAIIAKISDKTHWQRTKSVLTILDDNPIVTEGQLEFWEWIKSYYLCSIGEVMQAALPAHFKLASETKISRSSVEPENNNNISDDEYLILEALEIRHELSIQDIQSILMKKTVMPVIQEMLKKSWLSLHEHLIDRGVPNLISWIRLHPNLQDDQTLLNVNLDKLQKSEKQSRSALAYFMLTKNNEWVLQKDLHKKSDTDSATTKALIKKQFYEVVHLEKFNYPNIKMSTKAVVLNAEQQSAYELILEQWKQRFCVLLHGITGSGKTMIYIELIRKVIAEGKQVLFLVPEIALTSQLVYRLKTYFGQDLLEYHSDLQGNSRYAMWHAVLRQHKIIIGARSSVFLPFTNLGLIIVDEEHDASYKQTDPSPRYNARDLALILGKKYDAKVLLGSATPSIESYYNAQMDRYGLVELHQRFGESALPDIEVISLKLAEQLGQMKGLFTARMLDEIQSQLDQKKQILIFRNRRGYSPLLQCMNCNWEAICPNCDIHLTMHKHYQRLKCHICGLTKPIPVKCPDCGNNNIKILGFGTEKIEEELQLNFPNINIRRLDLDVARTRKSQHDIIEDFQDGNADILVGTQMVTKGLDFNNVGLVGVLQADQIMFYPDFRATERAFQLLTQVAGRSGRRVDSGCVLIQAYNIGHPVLQYVMDHDYKSFYQREILERQKFLYPPYIRLIRIELRHLKIQIVEEAAQYLCKELHKKIGKKRILGPAEPHLGKIKGSYIREILLKIEKDTDLIIKIKNILLELSDEVKNQKGCSSVRIIFDVDVY